MKLCQGLIRLVDDVSSYITKLDKVNSGIGGVKPVWYRMKELRRVIQFINGIHALYTMATFGRSIQLCLAPLCQFRCVEIQLFVQYLADFGFVLVLFWDVYLFLSPFMLCTT